MIDADEGLAKAMVDNRILFTRQCPRHSKMGLMHQLFTQTLFEAVMVRHRLPMGQKSSATVEDLGGLIYYPNQIERLYMPAQAP
jgi:hypothetical protein